MMCSYGKSRDDGVSPVVGVMLMLVVTIIIAAVVSAYAGGLGKTTDTAPTGSFDVHISNDGTWGGSAFHADVLAVSDAIPTKDLKIVTAWKSANGTPGGATIIGPLTTPNTNYEGGIKNYTSPLGFGPSIEGWESAGNYIVGQHFGNYSLIAGSSMHNSAAGYSTTTGGYGVTPSARYQYSTGSYLLAPGEGGVDAMMAILGNNWYVLRPGDAVHVKFIHIPSGKVIFDKDITVEG
ncbi:MAG: type IV pilin N-terminal domain-containing protein [Methanoregulaceae archaeon]